MGWHILIPFTSKMKHLITSAFPSDWWPATSRCWLLSQLGALSIYTKGRATSVTHKGHASWARTEINLCYFIPLKIRRCLLPQHNLSYTDWLRTTITDSTAKGSPPWRRREYRLLTLARAGFRSAISEHSVWLRWKICLLLNKHCDCCLLLDNKLSQYLAALAHRPPPYTVSNQS